jgi:hypothetical protein
MPGFLSVNRMHEHTGLHRETVRKCLQELEEWGLIRVFRRARISAILLAPPPEYHFGDDDPSQAIDKYLNSIAK